MTTGIDDFIVAKELKWKAKLRHWLVKRQNTISMPQWCPEQPPEKRLKDKLNALLTVNEILDKTRFCLLCLFNFQTLNFRATLALVMSDQWDKD